MANVFDYLFGPGSRPLRQDIDFRITFDKEGKPVVLPLNGKCHTLSRDGAINGGSLIQDHFYSCGHPMSFPLGGQCVECGRLSCLQCFWTCSTCHCPLCKRHGITAKSEQGSEVTLCASCYDVLKRSRFIKRLLSPFVSFGDTQPEESEGGR